VIDSAASDHPQSDRVPSRATTCHPVLLGG
jgi:hypothetical protein